MCCPTVALGRNGTLITALSEATRCHSTTRRRRRSALIGRISDQPFCLRGEPFCLHLWSYEVLFPGLCISARYSDGEFNVQRVNVRASFDLNVDAGSSRILINHHATKRTRPYN